MGRRRKSGLLVVWMNGERVGEWHQRAGGHEFRYDKSWFDSAAARPISLSLPLRPSREPYRLGVEAFFDNLLPDSRQIRERLQRRFAAESSGVFDLLWEIGRDCIGALQLLPPDAPSPKVKTITGERLTASDVAAVLSDAVNPLMGQERTASEFRISLAGAQEKTALLRHEGTWHLPTGATPTTHIFKLPLGSNQQGIDLSSSVENEWLCARVLQEFNLPVASCEIATFGEQRVLVVERFDRKLSTDGTWWMRLPQEDFCQATATAPVFKYESDGGPGIPQIMDILLGSQQARTDREIFMRTQFVFWLLAAIDGHAKNFSITHLAGGDYRLAPNYDVLSAYPIIGRGRGKLAVQKVKMAMALSGKNRHYLWQEMRVRHWLETAKRCGITNMQEIMGEITSAVPDVVHRVGSRLPRAVPAELAESILEGVQLAAKQVKREL